MKGILLMYKRMIFFKLNIFDNDSQDLAAVSDQENHNNFLLSYKVKIIWFYNF